MTLFEEKIINHLENAGILQAQSIQDIRENADASEMSFEKYLVRKHKVSEKNLLDAKSDIAGVPSWKYDEGTPIEKEVLKMIPAEVAEQYRFVPVAIRGKTLVIGFVNPTDLQSQQALRFILLRSDLEPYVVAITESDYKEIYSLYKGLRVEVKSALEEIQKGLEEETKKVKRPGGAKKAELREAPITKIAAVVLKHAIEGNASDIHIEPLRNNSRVRFRVDGVLYSSLMLPIAVHSSLVARIKILSQLRLDESRIPQDGRFSTTVNGRLIDFRVSTLPTNLGEKVVMRVLDPSAVVLEFEQLGLVGENRRRFENAIAQPFGMILVSGPTGSGKTTTLYAALSKVDKQTKNVVSLEDPVEYYMEGVSQSQIKPEINYTFASGLRHLVRQDPDVMMVGEIRDVETADLAIQAALTGHIIFTTIHTNNAIGVIPRLTDLGVEPFLIPSAVLLAAAQRLVGRLCPHCKKERTPHQKIARIVDEELSRLPSEYLKEFDIKKPYKVWDSEGCTKCNNKRTKGRVAIYEVLKMTDELRQIILEKEASAIAIEKEAVRQGMISMKQDGIIKALQGIVAIEDVLRVVEE